MPVPQGTQPQTLSDRAKAGLLDLAENQVRNGLNEFGSAASNLPEFLAGPTPSSPAALPLYGITRAACRSYARGFGPQNLPGFDSAWAGICEPYLDTIGENPSPGSIAPPFEGGQCVGVNYFGEASFTDSQGGRQTGGFLLRGPIQGLSTAGTPNGGTEIRVTGTMANGQPDVRVIGTVPAGVIPAPSLVILGTQGNVPDNCGDPPPDYNPPEIVGGLPPLPPQPVDFPGIGPVGVDVTFGPDGEIIIDFPGIDSDVTIGNPFGGGGGDAPVEEPPGPGEAGQPATSGVGGDAEGEAGPGEELVGVQVEVLQASENVNTFDNVADIVYRGIGYVRMGYPGRLGLDISGGTVLAPQFFHAQQRGLTAWAVRANLGFILRVTPYYRSLEQ